MTDASTGAEADPKPRKRSLLRELYHGATPRARAFRFAAIVVDLLIIAFFILEPMIREAASFWFFDYLIAGVLALDLIARAVAFGNFSRWIQRPIVWIDLLVLISLLAHEYVLNLGFLRILRLATLFNSGLFWRTINKGNWLGTRVEEISKAAAILITFIFIATGFVYTGFARQAEGLNSYLDALYFTIATLTTTGFGDVTLPGDWGKLLSIVIMVTGITLFVRLAQSVFRPNKVSFPCPQCGLGRHDPDAVHCKACGTILKIPNDAD